jgi:hypothetical protein
MSTDWDRHETEMAAFVAEQEFQRALRDAADELSLLELALATDARSPEDVRDDLSLWENEMRPVWGRLAERRPRATRTYGWPASIALVVALALLLLAVGGIAGWLL